MEQMTPILKVEGLYKRFKLSRKQQKLNKTTDTYKQAVDNVSFCAYKGEIFGLLGPNGAGKTTTMRILSTLIRPDKGTAWLNGANIITEANTARSQLGFLTGDLKLEQFFTPDYLFNFFSDLHGVDPQTQNRRKEALFSRFGITDFAQTKVAELSQGMRQKVSLVVSLVHDPDVIIFDEPTNGLDVLTAKVVTDFLLELKAQGKTILVSTHIFSLIEKLCDRVAVLIDGKVVACDSLEAVCDGMSLEDRFFHLYSSVKGGALE